MGATSEPAARSFVERLRDPLCVHEEVRRIKDLTRRLGNLIADAEDDLLSYYNPKARVFVRLTTDARIDAPPTNLTSSAGAITSLEAFPVTGKSWPEYRADVIRNVKATPRAGSGARGFWKGILEGFQGGDRSGTSSQFWWPGKADEAFGEGEGAHLR
jgi:hypothetical protein